MSIRGAIMFASYCTLTASRQELNGVLGITYRLTQRHTDQSTSLHMLRYKGILHSPPDFLPSALPQHGQLEFPPRNRT